MIIIKTRVMGLWANNYTFDSVIVCPYYCLFMFAYYFSLIPVIVSFICSHVICTCTFPSILTHLLRVLTPWICTFRSMYILSAGQVFGEDHWHLEELEFSYSIILSRYSLVSLYSHCYHDSVHWTHCLFFSFIHLLSCVVIYMLYCSVTYHHSD